MALGSDAAASRAAADTGPAGSGAPPSAGQAPEELIEIQLRAILESTQTSAGAVCLFDQHQELLRLAVEVGLSDEGCRRLRSVRRGAATTWDMPLHSLLNRRVYLIESAAKNRYVPPLVDDIARVRAVACIPLYDGSTPVGSLILVALAPRSFGERQIRMLESPARELVGSIVAMRKRVTGAGPVRVGKSSLSAAATPVGVQLAGPTAPGIKTAPGATSGPSAAIQVAVDRARAELERLRGRLSEADDVAAKERARADEHAQHLRELQSRASELQAERERLTEALAARTHECEVLQDRVAATEAALGEARGTEAGLRAELEHARTTNVAAAESETSAAVGTLEARIAELQATNEHLRERTAELEVAEREARTAAERQVADAGAAADARLAAATDASALAERRATEVVAELDGLRGEVAAMRSAHAHALEETERRHASALADTAARITAAEQTALDLQRRCESLDAELATTRAAAGSQQDHAEALTQERAHWDAERVAAREREAALAARIDELQAEIERTRREDSQLRDGFAHLESLIQTGIEAGAAPTNGGTIDLSDASTFEVVELDETSAGVDDGGSGGPLDVDLVIEEVEPAPTPTPATAPTACAEGVLVIDTETHWPQAAPSGTKLDVAAPDAAAGEPAQILVNLAAPNALVALARLRASGVAAPCVAYVGVAGQPRALLVSRFELAARPIDPDALLSALPGRFARGTRVVTAGADVDGLISLRQALARLGVSVSMAWDAKQAGDLLSMVHPDVAIIDLELPPKDGCALVARMALAQPPPLTIVIPKAGDMASGFAAAVAHPELSRMTLPPKELLTRALGLMTAPAPKR
jgi:CheY-like chemotaxis protein